MSGSLTTERMHNTRARRLQKVHPLTHTQEGFREREKTTGIIESQCLTTSPRSSGLTAGTHLPNLQGGKINEKSDPLLCAQSQVLLHQNRYGRAEG